MGNASQRPEGGDKASVRETAPAEPEKPREDIRDKYELGKVLGSGSFGQVREAILKELPDKVRAVKIIERDDDAEGGGEWSNSAMFRQEVALLQNLKHDNIVRFWDVYEDVHFLYVVMDLCRGGEVFSKILELRRFTEANAATLGSQMLAAIAYIHSKSIMHRDIKAENFLLSDKSPTSVVKMIDFGMAVKFDHGIWFKEICGSPHYLAPELIGQKYNQMVDMWAFGVLMYLLMYGHYPYDSKNTRDIMMKVLTEPIRWQTKAKLSQQTLGFLKRCLEPSVRKRMTAEDGLKHPWIVGAAAPDPELEREASTKNEDVEDLNEFVRSAHRKVTSSRKQVDQEAETRRTEMLEKINKDFEKGIRLGNRLGETPQEDFMSRPEFVRRDNRLTTAPSKAVSESKTKAATPAAGNDNKVVQLTPTPKADPKAAEKGKKKVVSIAENQATEDDDQPVKHQRKKKQAQTARLMYLGDLEEKDEDDMRKLWQQWKSQDLEGNLVAHHESEEDQNPKNDIQNAVDKLRTEAARKAEEEDSDGPPSNKVQKPDAAARRKGAEGRTSKDSRNGGFSGVMPDPKAAKLPGAVD
mmetsp:Transcript_65015/g.152117  ORF Transcript_65015/g.152117 Transcript_65015/m.152117 type:complete len:581 (+) Transcript_65015:164-1906(+)